MTIAVQQISPVAHLPLILGVLRRLEVATVVYPLAADICLILQIR